MIPIDGLPSRFNQKVHNKEFRQNLRGPQQCMDPESQDKGGRGPTESTAGEGGHGWGGRRSFHRVSKNNERKKPAQEKPA